MVNPVKSVKKLYRYWQASVINDIIVDVAFFTLIAMSAYTRVPLLASLGCRTDHTMCRP